MADLTQFDVRSARRIARVVQAVELEPRRASPLTFDPVIEQRSDKVFRVCTYTGDWPAGSSKTVTFKNQTTTPNTVSAVNLFLTLPDNGERNCAIAKDGTAWHLIQWQWDASTAVSSATLGTASLVFSRINVPSLGTASTVSISVTTCSTATAS
jgi:hypothetical protein